MGASSINRNCNWGFNTHTNPKHNPKAKKRLAQVALFVLSIEQTLIHSIFTTSIYWKLAQHAA